MPQKVFYSVVADAPLEVVWQVITDWRRWTEWSALYKRVECIAGSEWAPGTRFRITIEEPAPTTLNHLITAVDRPRRYTVIYHAFTTTVEQQVEFNPVGDKTVINISAEYAGPLTEFLGVSVGDALRGLIARWYNTFRDECNRRACGHPACCAE